MAVAAFSNPRRQSYTAAAQTPQPLEKLLPVYSEVDGLRSNMELGGRLHQALWGSHPQVNPYQRCLTRIAAVLEPSVTSIELLEAVAEDEYFDDLSLTNCLAELGYHASTLQLTPRDIDPRLLPCIFTPHGGDAKPIVILSHGTTPHGATFVIYRGESDDVERILPDDAFHNADGTGIFFRKKSASELSTSKQIRSDTNQTWFGATFARFRPIVWQLTAVGILLNIIALATPIFVMIIYDRVISPQTTENVPMLLTGAAFALALEFALRMQRTRLLSWMTARIHYIVGTEVFKRLIELPPIAIQQASLTAQIARIRSFESVRDFFSGPIFASTIELPSVIVSILVLMFFSIKLALIPIASLFFYAAAFAILRQSIGTAIKVAATEASVAQRFCTEALQEREEIRANGLVDLWKQKFREISGRENAAYAKLHFLSAAGEHIAYAITVLTGLFALLLGVSLVWSGELSTGMLVAAMILVWRSISPFSSVCSQIARFEQFRNSIRQINRLMEVETENEIRSVTTRIPKLTGAIEMQNLALRYNRDSGPIFHGLNCRIAAGESIAICGSMGTGKTSLLNLIQCMSNPHAGKIQIDDLNIQQLDSRELRRQIAYIPQSPQAYPGTIAENLRIVLPETTDEMLWKALDRVGARSFVKTLPLELEQPIQTCRHDREFLLRLAFARAHIQKSNLILIDEIASSFLNNGLERIVTETISSARGQRTVIFVSQRVDHLRMADRVIGLRHGRTPIIGSLDKILEATA